MVRDQLNFAWDQGNLAHIAKHKVTPDEAEEVVLGDPPRY